VADGLVELDDSANRHLGTIRLSSDAVTIRHLLTHTSGVSSAFEHFAVAVPPVAQVLGAKVNVDFPPGSEHRYSNGGYAVLGELIAHVRGLTYAQVVESDIFDPLEMKASGILMDWPDDAPCGYIVRDGSAAVTDRRVPSVQAAGGLYTTAGDLGRFLAGWATLIPEDLAVKATSPQVELGGERWQGYGWMITTAGGLPVVGHGGGVLGFRASLLWDMTGERASVVLVNSENDQTEALNRSLLPMT
jgi:CubicO group peptidase (beta-lactamase class C family)